MLFLIINIYYNIFINYFKLLYNIKILKVDLNKVILKDLKEVITYTIKKNYKIIYK